jgi:hypothetical protein
MRNKIDFKTLEKINNEIGEFDLGQVHGGSNDVYFRFGYWKQVDLNKLNEILGHLNKVVEDEDYDDDCGWQYSYKFV